MEATGQPTNLQEKKAKMNQALEMLKERRSIRAYTSQPVAREVLEDIVDFGDWRRLR